MERTVIPSANAIGSEANTQALREELEGFAFQRQAYLEFKAEFLGRW